MDKGKVFAAYRKGFITLHECKQILGVSTRQLRSMMDADDIRTQRMTLGSRLKQAVR